VPKIKIIVADDQLLICDGIRIILDSQPDIEVVAIADNGRTAVEYVSQYQPDLVLMDIQMPGMTGIEALKDIKSKYPKTLVLMLTTFDPDEYILGAFRNGADGYLLKDLSGDKLAAAIRDAYAGNITIPASIAARIVAQIPKETRRRTLSDYGLTQREMEIAELITKGYNNESIVRELGITLGTVKNYISTLYSKLEADNRKEAIYIITGLNNGGKH
jgi:DNA-binding NarL/FixJ family response regulator